MVGRSCRIVEVWLDGFGLIHRSFQPVIESEHFRTTVVLNHSVQCGFHGWHTAITVLVDTVSEAHDLLLRGQGFLHPGFGSCGGLVPGFVLIDPDLIEGVHDRFVGPTV